MACVIGATTRTAITVALLIAAGAATVCAAAGPSHPSVAVGTGCVTSRCHERLLAAAQENDGSFHQPAGGGDCASCHDLALAPAARFVRGAPADRDDGPERARAWDLELCAGCHGEGLLAANAPAATGFRDGKRNLHALHVQAGRGRRCLPCHGPHAARQPKLLRELIPARGSARIPQEFRGRPQGGWCRTGCHAPKRYTR